MTKNMFEWRFALKWSSFENWYHFRWELSATDDLRDTFESLCEAFPFTGDVFVCFLALNATFDRLLVSTLESVNTVLLLVELILDNVVVFSGQLVSYKRFVALLVKTLD